MNFCLFDALHGFSVWLRTSPNPADIIDFKAILEKELKNLLFVFMLVLFMKKYLASCFSEME